VVSISSNIAEGYEKENKNEFYRYLCIAKGSLGEAKSQIYLAKEIGYIDEKVFNIVNVKLEALGKQVGGFMKYLRTKKRMDNK
jgi:four helix bundle protein